MNVHVCSSDNEEVAVTYFRTGNDPQDYTSEEVFFSLMT